MISRKSRRYSRENNNKNGFPEEKVMQESSGVCKCDEPRPPLAEIVHHRKKQRLEKSTSDILQKAQGSSLCPALQCNVLATSDIHNSAKDEQSLWFDASNNDHIRIIKSVLSLSPPAITLQPTCREEQGRKILSHIHGHLETQSGCCLYVSGPPGTGKSMTVHQVVNSIVLSNLDIAAISVNCMSVHKAEDIFARIYQGMEEAREVGRPSKETAQIIFPGTQAPENVTLDKLVKTFRCNPTKALRGGSKRAWRPKATVLILDEMDALLFKQEDVVCHLFRLPQMPKSNLLLIGISNSIDLTVRTLAALEQQKLQKLPGPAFNPLGLRLCAKKVAAASGDMRCALEACSLAVDEHAASNQSEQPGLISVQNMSQALSKILGGMGSASSTVLLIQGLPQQQQLLICSAAQIMSKEKENGERKPKGAQDLHVCQWSELQQAYLQNCKLVGIRALNGLELRSAAATLTDMGLLRQGKGQGRQRRVTLGATLQEILLALEDRRIFSGMLTKS
eukprot:jgi/Botrbrau1/9058/Bobra.0376s0032.1